MTVTLQRQYPAEAADVWDALTDPERVRRWFLPLSGDLREGGAFQLEGNASGDILRCAAPERLVVTFGAPNSVVEVRLVEQGEGTLLILEHSVPLAIAGSGAGALYVGPGCGTARCWRWRSASTASSPTTRSPPATRWRPSSSVPGPSTSGWA